MERHGQGDLACTLAALALLGCSSGHPAEAIGIDHSRDTGPLGFCRTTTCTPPADYPTPEGCQPPDWSDSAFCRGQNKTGGPLSNAPVWWRTACVGYDLQKNASRHVAYADFASAVERAFATWEGASCPSSGGNASVSIGARDLGPVTCTTAGYNKDGPNQSLFVFHDDGWPYEQSDQKKYGATVSPVVALTTVTFDVETGELLDADVEINSTDYEVIPLDGVDAGVAGAFDLQTVLTHEIGHFLGLAHSPLAAAVMYAAGDTSGGTRKRLLTAEDVAGICAIYPPDGTRSVSLLASPAGSVAEGACDPTPHGGFADGCGG